MKRTALSAIVLFYSSIGFCAELLVPSQYSTIQEAVNAASAGDTVEISPGTYTGTGNYNISFAEKTITVRSIEPNNPSIVQSTIIDCNGLGRGFTIDANVILDGLTIKNGNTGGIYSAGAPLIRNCDIIDNNKITGSGGGIYSATGNPTIVGCNIRGNHASEGGGIYCSNPTAIITITDCNIIANQSILGGGGISSRAGTGSIKITRTLIAGNIASGANGGGIYSLSGTVDINNSIVTGNFAQNNGGGIYQSSNYGVTVSNCTLAGNSAGSLSGGVYMASISYLSAACSIFWDNNDSTGVTTSAQIYPLPANPGQTLLFCCIADLQNKFGGANNGNINDDPMFVDFLNGDYHLQKDSPCIEAGNPLYVPGPDVTDFDGEPRLIGSTVDIGADEYDKIIVVTKPAGGEVWAEGSKHQIKWTKYGVGNVDIRLSDDGGTVWQTIAYNIDANSLLCTIPRGINSDECLISVEPNNGDSNVIVFPGGELSILPYPMLPAVPPSLAGKLPGPDLSQNVGPEVGCIKWVFDTKGPVSSQVAVTRPYWDTYGIYIGCEDGNLYAMDDLGNFLWSYDINSPIVGSPAAGYYWMVYVAGQNGWLYAIDDYGQLRWKHKTEAAVYSTPVVGYDGKIYVCSEDGAIYALGADGSELWMFATKGPANLPGAILATPVIDKNGTVYVTGLYEPNLYALDVNTGSVKWVCNFTFYGDPCNPKSGEPFAAPAIGPNGTIYQVLVNDANLYAIDPCDGNILWATPMRPDPCYYCASDPCGFCCQVIDYYVTRLLNHQVVNYGGGYTYGYVDYFNECNAGRWQGVEAALWFNYWYSSGWSSPVVGKDGTIYVSFDDPYLRAINPDGTFKWITRVGMTGGFTLSIDKYDNIYTASDDNYVCVIDPNGQEISRFQGDGWVSFPTIAEDGTMIVSDANYKVWAITKYDCAPESRALNRPEILQNLQNQSSSQTIDFRDFVVFANSWLSCTEPGYTPCDANYGFAPADIDRDYYVDIWDLLQLVDKWLMDTNLETGWDTMPRNWLHSNEPILPNYPN